MNGVHEVFLNWELNAVHMDVNGTENGVDIFSVQKSVHAKKIIIIIIIMIIIK